MEIGCLNLRVSQDVLLESFDRSTALYMPADDFVIAEPFDWKTFVTGEDGCHSDANAPFAQRAHLTGVFAASFIFSIGVSVVIVVIRGFIDSVIELRRYEIEFSISGYDAGIVDLPRFVPDLPNSFIYLKSRDWIGGTGVVELNKFIARNDSTDICVGAGEAPYFLI